MWRSCLCWNAWQEYRNRAFRHRARCRAGCKSIRPVTCGWPNRWSSISLNGLKYEVRDYNQFLTFCEYGVFETVLTRDFGFHCHLIIDFLLRWWGGWQYGQLLRRVFDDSVRHELFPVFFFCKRCRLKCSIMKHWLVWVGDDYFWLSVIDWVDWFHYTGLRGFSWLFLPSPSSILLENVLMTTDLTFIT